MSYHMKVMSWHEIKKKERKTKLWTLLLKQIFNHWTTYPKSDHKEIPKKYHNMKKIPFIKSTQKQCSLGFVWKKCYFYNILIIVIRANPKWMTVGKNCNRSFISIIYMRSLLKTKIQNQNCCHTKYENGTLQNLI